MRELVTAVQWHVAPVAYEKQAAVTGCLGAGWKAAGLLQTKAIAESPTAVFGDRRGWNGS